MIPGTWDRAQTDITQSPSGAAIKTGEPLLVQAMLRDSFRNRLTNLGESGLSLRVKCGKALGDLIVSRLILDSGGMVRFEVRRTIITHSNTCACLETQSVLCFLKAICTEAGAGEWRLLAADGLPLSSSVAFDVRTTVMRSTISKLDDLSTQLVA